MTSLLNTKALNVKIGKTVVCQDLSFAVEPGETAGILGVNGVGKTTLLHTLAGLRLPASGEIFYKGAAIEELSSRQRAQFRGILFQNKLDTFPATVMESVMIGRHPFIDRLQWESKNDIAIAEATIAQMDLQDKQNQLVN